MSASAELLITVTGVNDPAVIVVDAPDVSVTRNAQFDAVAGGQVSISDLDLNQAEIVSPPRPLLASSRLALMAAGYMTWMTPTVKLLRSMRGLAETADRHDHFCQR